ncbi:MAG: DedA family protein [Longimicrobiales bacterium]|nr:DedA family protein [Longimicrobiales bacterium]
MVATLFEQLALHGPWLLFAMAILETCFVTGLVVPSGVATSAATILALEGGMALPVVATAAVCGGFVGDSLGFWIGRAWGERILREGGRWRTLLGPRLDQAEELFGRHPVYSVTVARLISFVRTLMPMAAGMSGLSYRRYVPYEIVGVVGWAVIYMTMGFAGREGWEAATRYFGLGGAVLFVGASIVAWLIVRRRRDAFLAAEASQGSASVQDAG